MPIYEYVCKVCGKTIEIKQGINEDSKKEAFCDICKKEVEVEKLMSKNTFKLNFKN